MISGQSSRRGFSLIEALVAIGVIGVLIALSAPMLHDARRAVGQAVSLANLAGIGRTFEGYLAQGDGVYPVALEGVTHPVSFNGRLGFGAGDRWPTTWLWPAVIREFAPWEAHIHTWASPGSNKARRAIEEEWEHFMPDYWFSNSFIASPYLWTPAGAEEAPDAPHRVLQRVRAAHVAFPSSKVMHHDVTTAYNRRAGPPLPGGLRDQPTPMLFADGHAAANNPLDAAEAFPNPLNGSGWKAMRLQNTPRGVHGHDF